MQTQLEHACRTLDSEVPMSSSVSRSGSRGGLGAGGALVQSLMKFKQKADGASSAPPKQPNVSESSAHSYCAADSQASAACIQQPTSRQGFRGSAQGGATEVSRLFPGTERSLTLSRRRRRPRRQSRSRLSRRASLLTSR